MTFLLILIATCSDTVWLAMWQTACFGVGFLLLKSLPTDCQTLSLGMATC